MFVLPDSRYGVPAAPIFISYRRIETRAYAEYLYYVLGERFGGHAVFMDLNSIESGAPWLSNIHFGALTCQVMLVLIGQQWVTVTVPGTNRRKLDDPQDVLRLEVATALKRGIRVVPVLIDDARLPGADELPEDLKPLLEKQAYTISSAHMARDIGDLVKLLEPEISSRVQVVAEPVQAAYATPVAGAVPFMFAVNPGARDVIIVIAACATFVLIVYLFYLCLKSFRSQSG